MAEGVGVGFENETDNVKADMQASLTNLTAKMRATVEFENAKASESVVNKTLHETAVNADGDHKDDNVGGNVIETTIVIDGREIAKATTPYIDKELNKTTNRKKRGG